MLDEEHGLLTLHRPGGETTLLYLSPDLQVGNYTVLNFSVDDIDATVDTLTERGVSSCATRAPRRTRRASRAGSGPDIAWFKDPAGHTLSVLKEG